MLPFFQSTFQPRGTLVDVAQALKQHQQEPHFLPACEVLKLVLVREGFVPSTGHGLLQRDVIRQISGCYPAMGRSREAGHQKERKARKGMCRSSSAGPAQQQRAQVLQVQQRR